MLDTTVLEQNTLSPSFGGNFPELNSLTTNTMNTLGTDLFLSSTSHHEIALHSDYTIDSYINQNVEEVANISLANGVNSESLLGTQTITGQLDYTDELDYATFTFVDNYLLSGQEGEVQIDLSSSEFDSYLKLFDASTGSLLAYNDDGGTGTDSQLTFTAQAGVDYIIQATSFYGWETGNYTLTLTDDTSSPPTPPDPSHFDSIYGYGLVNAAAATAAAIGESLCRCF